jgi:hypothetical protein
MLEVILSIILITFSLSMSYRDNIKECISWCKSRILSCFYDN